ncbi:MAG: cofactor-independent phosphoglycerate mutase [Methanomicrobiales archaeon]|nr:cofactor-independent phosphoglycerate mutase [Methanomicrobiales archaeon]
MQKKYLVILGDGMADEPLAELGGKTPLEYAHTPAMDRIAREGSMGMVQTIPDGFEAGSDIANLGLLGYDPRTFYTGRGPLEAASMQIELGPSDIAYRCNLVTVRDGMMADFSAGHISSAEGRELISSLGNTVPSATFYPGVSYRNLLVLHGGSGSVTMPPHDIVGREIVSFLPRGRDGAALISCMEKSREIFSGHPVNRARVAAGKPPATQVWPWSGGKIPELPPFREKFGISGGIISAVDLLQGIARCAKMEVITVPGATGYLDTDYQAKARYARSALGTLDFLYLHVEAPDEAGHLGDPREKVLAIERLDAMIGTIMQDFSGVIAVLPDHPTPVRLKTHTADPVPFAVHGKGQDETCSFSEREGENGAYGTISATGLLPLLFSPSS